MPRGIYERTELTSKRHSLTKAKARLARLKAQGDEVFKVIDQLEDEVETLEAAK